MKKRKTIPLFVENDDGSFRINPAYTGKEKIICGHDKKTVATPVYVVNPEIRRVEARALASVYERRERHRYELLRKGGQVVHVNITQAKMKPRVVDMVVPNQRRETPGGASASLESAR